MSLFDLIKGVYYYCYSSIIIKKHINKDILKSKYFSGKLNGMFSIGWKWLYFSYKGNKSNGKRFKLPFPISPSQNVICPENIFFHPDDLNNFQSPGCYFQAIGKIFIGKGTFIGPNVGLITANHDPLHLNKHLDARPIVIGEKCWIGMNSIILPGIKLGENTIVGAGSIVTKSFSGNCVIAGNPAKKIKDLGEENDIDKKTI